jgi:hypothetical protein
MKSMDSKKAVGISDRLRQRLELIPNEVSVYNVVIPMRSVYLAAASFALLITINLLAINNNTQQHKAETTLETEYFSFLNQL